MQYNESQLVASKRSPLMRPTRAILMSDSETSVDSLKSGSHALKSMRDPWRLPRSAVLEYWTAVMVCLVWIQCSCGMPHVIRIGKITKSIINGHCLVRRVDVISGWGETCFI